ncbi:MAG TPA: universal stress protein [Acidimicrobiales bacterium]|nr:universal stress protein [Acidimicrobiales bacterium]
MSSTGSTTAATGQTSVQTSGQTSGQTSERTPLLVFGDDRSAHADRAWLWINNQRWPGWGVDVVTAGPDPGDVWSDELPIRFRPWEPADPRTPFAESGIGRVTHLRSGADPRLALESCRHADLVVVGPKGGRGVKTLFLGSTADHLLRNPPAPLVIATAPSPVTRALVCTDGSAAAQRAVEVFGRLPLSQGAHVAVIGVTGAGGDADAVRRGLDAAASSLAPLAPELIRAATTEEDNVAGVILDHAFALGAQLLVVGTRGLGGLRRILLGSTAGAVARVAPCSILVVPPEPAPEE